MSNNSRYGSPGRRGVMRRNQFARPWPEGEPTRPGERCALSDLLPDECACRIHKKPEIQDDTAQEEELDFS